MIEPMDTFDLVVRARRALVDRDGRPHETATAVGVRDGRVAALLPYDAPVRATRGAADDVTLAADEVLMPGLVDTHVHVNEPGRTEWEGFASATRAAAAGGVTTILDMPLNSVPPTTTVEALETKRDAARGEVAVDVGFWGGAVPENLADLGPLHDAGVFGFKCFLIDSGVEEFGHLEPPAFAVAMDAVARLGALMIVHAEDPAYLVESASAGPGYAGFLTSRPPASESAAIGRVVAEARRTGAHAHVVHLSSGEAVPDLHAARAAGVDVSVETCPHYLYFEAGEVPDGATEFKCCPPIRGADNRDRLWQALADGDIDMVVSDHSPSTAELKQAPGGPGAGDFAVAWGGIAGLQVSLPAVWTAAAGRGIDLARVVGWMATAPADRVGLTHKGRLAVGADADLVVLAPDEELTVDPASLAHKNPVSAYAGRRLRGVVRRTYLRGVRVDPDHPHGQLLVRGKRGSR
jgi:allantoinase